MKAYVVVQTIVLKGTFVVNKLVVLIMEQLIMTIFYGDL